jgi:hypothetical protein
MEKPLKGITNLEILINDMEPVLNEGEYVFATVEDIDSIPRSMTIGEFKEKEGTTVIISKKNAERLGLSFDFVAAWITLNVHSALDAVGLTAAFSSELARHDMSCNVVAGYYHDHLFIDYSNGEKAVEILQKMKTSKG